MAVTKTKKEEIVKELEALAKDAESLVFVNFHGLNVSNETKLRRSLEGEGVGYKVARKTLLARALKNKAEGEMPELTGEVAVAYGMDPIAPARGVFNFAKAHDGILKILGGVFGGKFVDRVLMEEIATIPTREVLLSKIAWLLHAPLQRFAIALNEVGKKK